MTKTRTDMKVRLSEQEYEALREAAHRRRVTHQQAMVEGLTLWLSSGKNEGSIKSNEGMEKPGAQDYNPSNQHHTSDWFRVLENILSSGHVLAVEAITRNLMAFDALIHSQKKGRNEAYHVPDHAHLTKELTRLLEEEVRSREERKRAIRPAKAG